MICWDLWITWKQSTPGWKLLEAIRNLQYQKLPLLQPLVEQTGKRKFSGMGEHKTTNCPLMEEPKKRNIICQQLLLTRKELS